MAGNGREGPVIRKICEKGDLFGDESLELSRVQLKV